jgi:Ca2+-binding RTX toxin-like protein
MIAQFILVNSTQLNMICTLLTLFFLIYLYFPVFTFGAQITGTNRVNTIYGTMGQDTIVGKDGKDNLYGNGGADTIHGDGGNDYVSGDLGDDKLEGNVGDDVIQGGSGSDEISGGKGNDTLIASFVLGSVSFRDFSVDKITCGAGYDMAYINPVDGDSASDTCEVVVAETAQ